MEKVDARGVSPSRAAPPLRRDPGATSSMAKAYDSTGKYLIEAFPADWLALVGLGAGRPVSLIDANLSTVTAEADKVIRLGGEEPCLAHFELQAGRDVRLPARLFRYNALLDERHDLPTRSVAVLLRPDADGPELTGEYRRSAPGLPDYLAFRYNILRVWQEPAATFLDGGLGTVPLAPVANLAGRPVEDEIRAVGARLAQAPQDQEATLWTATGILLGLRYRDDQAELLLRGVRQMKESSVYQAILAEGRAEGLAEGSLNHARRSVIRRGEQRFGPASAADRFRIDGMADLDRLDDWADLIGIAPVANWTEFWALVGVGEAAR